MTQTTSLCIDLSLPPCELQWLRLLFQFLNDEGSRSLQSSLSWSSETKPVWDTLFNRLELKARWGISAVELQKQQRELDPAITQDILHLWARECGREELVGALGSQKQCQMSFESQRLDKTPTDRHVARLPSCQLLGLWSMASFLTDYSQAGVCLRIQRLHHFRGFLEAIDAFRAMGAAVQLKETRRDDLGLWSTVEISSGALTALNLSSFPAWLTVLLDTGLMAPLLYLMQWCDAEHIFPISPRLDEVRVGWEPCFNMRLFGGGLRLKRKTQLSIESFYSSLPHVVLGDTHLPQFVTKLQRTRGDIDIAVKASRVRREKKRYLIAIDGPAGAGKSTVSKLLARRLNYQLIDTGAMFRSVAYCALQEKTPDGDICLLEKITSALDFQFRVEDGDNRVFVSYQGKSFEDWSDRIRTSEIGTKASQVSLVPGVRALLLEKQRKMGREGGIVMEGRDIGSVVFPDAEMKFFLTASVRARAQRRWRELIGRGETQRLESVEEEIRKRDLQDSQREVAPLVIAPGADVIDASELSLLETVDVLQKRVTNGLS